MKALVIGRHAGEIPGVETVEMRAVTFPRTADECAAVIRTLWNDANQLNARLIFQNLPGQVGVALARLMRDNPPLSVGVVISVPGPRLAGDVRSYGFSEYWDMTEAVRMVRQANPNCKIETEGNNTVTLTVDPPMRFEFSHIDWL